MAPKSGKRPHALGPRLPLSHRIRLQRECPMKKLFNRITEKQARVLTLCLLGAAAVLLVAFVLMRRNR